MDGPHMPGDSYQMSKTLCKSFKLDGSPCQGQGLKQFDGYCIAHAPADKTRAWRARGGKNSSTAARLDKRIPERLQVVIKGLAEGFTAVHEGTLSPAVYTAMCRGAKTMVDLYRGADEEMEAIRTEETQTAAAEIAGVHGNLDILKAADEITAHQDLYRIQSLIDQRLAKSIQTGNENRPVDYVLTAAGKRRFDRGGWSGYTHEDLDEIKKEAEKHTLARFELPEKIKFLTALRSDMAETLAHITRDPALDPEPSPDHAPPRDPLTGQPLYQPPAGVKSGRPSDADTVDAERAAEKLEDQISQVEELIWQFKENYKDTEFDLKEYMLHEGIDPDGDAPKPSKVKVKIFQSYWGKSNRTEDKENKS